jgi:hypothetical protein
LRQVGPPGWLSKIRIPSDFEPAADDLFPVGHDSDWNSNEFGMPPRDHLNSFVDLH